MPRKNPIVFALLTPLVIASAAAQAPLMTLGGDYRVVGIASANPLVIGSAPELRAITSGTMTFTPSGDYSWSFTTRTISLGVSPSVSTSTGTTGSYEVEVESLVTLEWGGLQADNEAHIRPDGEVFISGPHSSNAGFPSGGQASASFIGIRTSSGQSNSTMTGDYHLARFVLDYSSNELTITREISTANLLANGTWNESGESYTVSSSPFTSSTYSNQPHTFAVQPDGTLDVDGEIGCGVVSSDGEIATWVVSPSVSTNLRSEWVVALRAGTSRAASLLDGEWGQIGHGLAIDPGPQVDYYYTNYGEVFADAITSSSVAISTVEFDRGTSFGGNLSMTQGSYSLSQAPTPAGRFGIAINSYGAPPSWKGAVSDAGNYSFAFIVEPDQIMYLVALRKVAWAVQYGVGTPGTGGQVPSLDGNSFPFLGNANFGLRVDANPADNLAVLGLSLDSAAIPFAGGYIWIDPTPPSSTLTLFLVGGTANWSWPLPANNSFAGIAIHAQAVALSTAGVGGFALSNGLRFELGH